MLIPKVIHYCWFGKGTKPSSVIKCIDSWHQFCGDYKIIEWNENNFDIHSNEFIKEAYIAEKWAFITDYIRLYVLYCYGGIYMDTDVEVVKSIDAFLIYPAFSGFEGNDRIPTGIIGSQSGNLWIKLLLDYYTNRHFIMANGQMDMTTNVQIITNLTKKNYNIKLNNTVQSFKDFTMFPFDFFCTKDLQNKKIIITKNTYTIHHFSGTWLPIRKRLVNKLINVIGINNVLFLVRIKHFFEW